ncbi:hypothetical protein BGZ61DRAFT_447879 [Ilyonectria robusta]|uniref:uncharacterized protein n=1 Tax=Ilyonectria robusta TaxID=1079257 RepID=UPI001E8E02F5|nr:uncharacterized protein BGZ61DRAFT_447879 [Ilyonectria robusta]KAH8722039.1 hypothetical protein BGZ61DRAFT_447879 [Ilyonectria robusta]
MTRELPFALGLVPAALRVTFFPAVARPFFCFSDCFFLVPFSLARRDRGKKDKWRSSRSGRGGELPVGSTVTLRTLLFPTLAF